MFMVILRYMKLMLWQILQLIILPWFGISQLNFYKSQILQNNMIVLGEGPTGRFSSATLAAGNFNNDGYSDLAIGVPIIM